MANGSPQVTGLSEVLAQANTGKRIPALQLVKDNPGLAAMASKSISAIDKVNYTNDGARKITLPDVGRLNTIANKKARDISEARTVMQMLPDLELAAKIRISAVLSPKDLMTVELIFSIPPGIVPPAVLSHVTSAVSSHIDGVYKLKTKLPRMLREIMFEKGAYVAAVLAENAIDELINRHNAVSMESINDALEKSGYGTNLGFLGHSDTKVTGDLPASTAPAYSPRAGTNLAALEHDPATAALYRAYGTPNFASATPRTTNPNALRVNFAGHGDPAEEGKTRPATEAFMIPEIVFTDNPAVLRIPMAEEKIRGDKVREKLNMNIATAIAMEGVTDGTRPADMSKIDDRKLEQLLQKPRRNGWKQMEVVKTQSQLGRRTIGSPLIMELPPEAVIPVYKPGQEERHVGYFVLLDQTGNPVRLENYRDVYADMSNRFNFTESSQSSTVIDRLRQLTNGFQCTDINHLDNTVRIWGDMVEADFAARLRNSLHHNGVRIAKNNDYYLLMLSRMLAQQRTTILFLPVETTEYFAMKYDENGVGVSYMDEMKVLNNMQAIVIFANTMASLKNSIARTDVDLELDESDPDPQKTIDVIMDVLMRNNQSAFPLGIDSPADLVNYLSRAQYKFNIQGHPGLPQHKITFSEGQTQYGKVDTDLSDDLNRRQMRSLGVDPEIINNGLGRDMTATEIMSNNLMLSKTAMTDQEILNPQLTSYVRKIARVDEPLLKELRDIIDGAYDQIDVDKEEIQKELGLADEKVTRGVIVSHILNQVIERIEVALPKPNTTSEQSQLDGIKVHEELVDAVIESYISDAFLTDNVGGDVSSIVNDIKANLKAMMMRQYYADNGILPELAKFMNSEDSNEETKTLWEQNREYGKILMELLGDYALKIKEARVKSDKVMAAVGQNPDGGGTMGDFTNNNDQPGGPGQQVEDPFALPGDIDEVPSPEQIDEQIAQTTQTATPPGEGEGGEGATAPGAM